jgi:hypothetical protein
MLQRLTNSEAIGFDEQDQGKLRRNIPPCRIMNKAIESLGLALFRRFGVRKLDNAWAAPLGCSRN